MSRADEVLQFWFGAADAPRRAWFEKSDAFDAEIRDRFGALVRSALDGGCTDWERTINGRLALIVLLDQFTRNIHRATPRAFAGDARALALAERVVLQEQDRSLPFMRRSFVYLPFMHAEDVALQQRSVQLHEALAADAEQAAERTPGAASEIAAAAASSLHYARRHHDVIGRFGRFPHRNAILGRASSAEEAQFLQQPGSSF